MAITNLYCRYAYRMRGNQPILVVMHGWSGDAAELTQADIDRLCEYGFFVIVPGLRGRNGASGARDGSRREIYDIIDAVERVKTLFPSRIHAEKVAIVGYSGGGGNALAAACKFPDYFTTIVSHFGMSDYGRDNPDGWYYNNGGGYTAGISSTFGGDPATVPNAYHSADATAAVQNFNGGKLYLYHDDQDATVPSVHSDRIGTAMDNASLTNYVKSITTITDDPRWTHGYPSDNADLIEAEPTWTAEILSRAAWTVPTDGTVTVIGYIVTKRFTIWLRANGSTTYGLDAAATVVYDTATDTYTVTPLTGAIDVTITQGAKTGSATNISTETEIVVI